MWPRTSISSTTPGLGARIGTLGLRIRVSRSLAAPCHPCLAILANEIEVDVDPCCQLIARVVTRRRPLGGSYFSSPASIARLNRFCGGASGQVA